MEHGCDVGRVCGRAHCLVWYECVCSDELKDKMCRVRVLEKEMRVKPAMRGNPSVLASFPLCLLWSPRMAEAEQCSMSLSRVGMPSESTHFFRNLHIEAGRRGWGIHLRCDP